MRYLRKAKIGTRAAVGLLTEELKRARDIGLIWLRRLRAAKNSLKRRNERATMDNSLIGPDKKVPMGCYCPLKLRAELRPDTRRKWIVSRVAQAGGGITRLLIMDVAPVHGIGRVAVEI